jgi:hypothetical protein
MIDGQIRSINPTFRRSSPRLRFRLDIEGLKLRLVAFAPDLDEPSFTPFGYTRHASFRVSALCHGEEKAILKG